eukprot:scaffold258982_cov17-Prasinocladus_malaysianus.AAC.1
MAAFASIGLCISSRKEMSFVMSFAPNAGLSWRVAMEAQTYENDSAKAGAYHEDRAQIGTLRKLGELVCHHAGR